MNDLVVVGGGPAGLAVALEARLRGLAVVVCDGRRPPIEKACGEGLMPDGRARLLELGVELPAGRPFRGIHYLEGELSIPGAFPAGHDGAGIRRLALHQALADRAATLGVDLRWGLKVRGLTSTGVDTEAGPLDARLVVGADGLLSDCRAWAGLAGPPAPRRRFGVRRHFALAPWSEMVEVHWGQGVEAYVTPVGEDEVGVAFLWSGGPADFDTLLGGFPSLASRLRGAEASSRHRGAGPLEQKTRGLLKKLGPATDLALVGDAAGYLDAITGEGLSLACHQAHALVACFAAGRLAGYPRALRRIGRLPEALTRLTLFLHRHAKVRRRVFRALAADPALFDAFLAVHTRARPAASLLRPAFGARLLRRLAG